MKYIFLFDNEDPDKAYIQDVEEGETIGELAMGLEPTLTLFGIDGEKATYDLNDLEKIVRYSKATNQLMKFDALQEARKA